LPGRLVSSNSTRLKKPNTLSLTGDKEEVKGGAAIYFLNPNIRIHEAYTGNGLTWAIISIGNSLRLGVMCAYCPPASSVLNSRLATNYRADASSSALLVAVEEELKKIQQKVAMTYLATDLNLRLGRMGGLRESEDKVSGHPLALGFCQRTGLRPVAGDKAIKAEFPTNAIGGLESRAITGSAPVGATGVDYIMYDTKGSKDVRQIAVKCPFDFSHPSLVNDKSISHLPVLTAVQIPSTTLISRAPKAPARFVMPHTVPGDDRFIMINKLILGALRKATSEGRNSEECSRLVTGCLQRILCSTFTPKAARGAKLFSLAPDVERELLSEIEHAMAGNVSPAKRVSKLEQQLQDLRGPIIRLCSRKRELDAAEAEGRVDKDQALSIREDLDRQEQELRRLRREYRNQRDEALEYKEKLRQQKADDDRKRALERGFNVRKAIISSLAEERESLRVSDPHSFNRHQLDHTSDDDDSYVEATVGETPPAVVTAVLQRLAESREKPRALITTCLTAPRRRLLVRASVLMRT
jgi:hypothetical protein